MSIFDWLFSDVEIARREAIARVNAAWRRSEERNERQRPVHDLIQRVVPLVEAVELRGERPMTLFLPQSEIDALADAFRALGEDLGRPDYGMEGARLMGLEIKPGDSLRVA